MRRNRGGAQRSQRYQRSRTDQQTGSPPSRALILKSAQGRDEFRRLIRINALGIESDDVVNYCFPTTWPTDRARRARYIGEWLNRGALSGLVTEPRRFQPPFKESIRAPR